ncbi:c-type cytochrome [Bacterioplanoides sp.]|uniref:c-type cytochrome n=1 Tax=Bacterioplanoides sp. TaxID=2066072 RepID=UPI003B00BD9C
MPRLLFWLLCLTSSLTAIPASAVTNNTTDSYTVELYDLYCTACHAVSASGAPQAFIRDEWQDRLDKGMETLVNNAITGIGNMPAMGTCGECSAEDMEDLIRYMVQEQ